MLMADESVKNAEQELHRCLQQMAAKGLKQSGKIAKPSASQTTTTAAAGTTPLPNNNDQSEEPIDPPSDVSDDLMAMQEASFDPDKTLCCKVENGHTLVHGPGGRGYGLGATPITSGCYQWKVRNDTRVS